MAAKDNKRNIILERFFNTLISGNREAARGIVQEILDADVDAERVITNLFWPTLEKVQQLHRADQMTNMAHNFAVRLLRVLADQMALRLGNEEANNRRVLLVCGPEEPEELAAQMTCDLLESKGYTVFFAGGGIANDEIVANIMDTEMDVLLVFGATPSTVPFTRQLIDRLHDMDIRRRLQICVGGGVFNRADGLAEEIGADLWGNNPAEMVEAMLDEPSRRMTGDQRTVGRKRRQARTAA